MDCFSHLWLPFVALMSLLTKCSGLICYQCLHLEMESNHDWLNDLLTVGAIEDSACKESGDEFYNSNPLQTECEWTDDHRFLKGSDVEDFYNNNNYSDYIGDYYNDMYNSGPDQVTCQRDVGTSKMNLLGITLTVKIWGRGCQAIPGKHGYAIEGCTTDITSYEHSLLYVLHKESGGIMDLDGNICICQTDLCNSAAIYGPSSLMLAALLLLASRLALM